MNAKFAQLLLTSACAVGLCGAAAAQSMSPPPNSQAPATTQQPAMAQQSGSAMQSLPVDQQTSVSGVQVMCGGIAADESDPKYANYPAKVEVAGGYGQWLGDNDISISGAQSVSAHCTGPWFMAQLQPGRYTVSVTHGSTTHTARLTVAANGQHKVVVRFPHLEKGKGPNESNAPGMNNPAPNGGM
jgi:hypothetical protein